MHGEYISKAECFEHAEEIERTMDTYSHVMDAMEEYEHQMRTCTCGWDGDAHDDGMPYTYRIPNRDCSVHAQEDAEDAEA